MCRISLCNFVINGHNDCVKGLGFKMGDEGF